jgi:hypothetical protein
MARGIAALLGIALASTGCTFGVVAGPVNEPLPSAPSAPDGWQSAGSYGGSGPGWGGMELTLAAGPVAIHAACAGSGDLVVAVGSGEGPRTSVVMHCGEAGDVAEGRWLLPDPVTAGTATFSTTVVEGLGDLRHPSYEVSIEQPAP